MKLSAKKENAPHECHEKSSHHIAAPSILASGMEAHEDKRKSRNDRR